MHKIKMFCLTLDPMHYDAIQNLGYIPVGLGNSKFGKNWITDKCKYNISKKNKYYGEYTFHYCLWKNNFHFNKNEWIGFCQYRKFWLKKKINNNNITNLKKLNNIVLKSISTNLRNYESILVEKTYVNKFKLSKFVKHNFKKFLFNPSLFFDSKKRNINFHFDMMHGDGNLEKATNLLPDNDKISFREFINNNVSFNPHNMFICKNKAILFNYYNSVFPWLKRCEKLFGFKNLKGYGQQRIYGFLAERYASYWFKRYTKNVEIPFFFKNIDDLI